MDWLLLVLGSLGIYRIAYMITGEEGPFSIFSWLRGRVSQETWFGRGLHCPLCVSWWLAFWPALAWAPYHLIILYWLGIAGGVLVLHQWSHKR